MMWPQALGIKHEQVKFLRLCMEIYRSGNIMYEISSQTQIHYYQTFRVLYALFFKFHYSNVIMSTLASQITSFTVVYSTVFHSQIKKNIKAPRHWPCAGNSLVSAQRASNEDSASFWWRHHEIHYYQHKQCHCMTFHLLRVTFSNSFLKQNSIIRCSQH